MRPLNLTLLILILFMLGSPALAAPVAVDDAYTTAYETSLTIDRPAAGLLVNDTTDNTLLEVYIGQDADPGLQSIEVMSENGLITLFRDGTFIYTPNLLFSGVDTFTYLAYDGVTTSAEIATVSIMVNAGGVVTAQDDYYTAAVGETLIISTPSANPLQNDAPKSLMLDAAVESIQTAEGGTVSMNTDGTFTYDPPSGAFIGLDSFIYTASEANNAVNSAQATVFITVVDVNLLPSDLQTDRAVYVGAPVYPVFGWQAASNGEWYELVVLDSQDTVMYREWFPATAVQSPLTGQDPVCVGVICAITTDVLPNYTFGDDDYSWYIGVWNAATEETRYNEVENAGTFTVDVPQPKNAGFTVNSAIGWPTITWPDDQAITWVHVWVGPTGIRGIYQEWHTRDAAEGPSFTCDGETCTMTLPWDGDSALNPYQIWMQTWGPDGFGEGTAENWFQVTEGLLLPTNRVDLPVDVLVPNNATPIVTFTGAIGLSWYRLQLAGANNQFINAYGGMDGWYTAEELGCLGGGGKVCTVPYPFGEAGLSAGTYRIFVQGWGPAGFGVNGNYEDDPAFSVASFTVN